MPLKAERWSVPCTLNYVSTIELKQMRSLTRSAFDSSAYYFTVHHSSHHSEELRTAIMSHDPNYEMSRRSIACRNYPPNGWKRKCGLHSTGSSLRCKPGMSWPSFRTCICRRDHGRCARLKSSKSFCKLVFRLHTLQFSSLRIPSYCSTQQSSPPGTPGALESR